LRRDRSADEYEYDEEQPNGRWSRERSGGRRWLRIALFLLVIPLLIGAGVAFFAGRPIAFDVIRRATDHKFPSGKWLDAAELVRWRADPSRPAPVLLDARTEDEYAVSHLGGAVRIDPYRPSLRPLRGFSKDTVIVLYSSVGYRGARVADFLARQGYTQVYNLEGGQFRWANEGHPSFRHDSPTAEVHPYNPTWGLLLESQYRIKAPPIEKKSAAP
jgi:rhodanese-related sulfurtransferase